MSSAPGPWLRLTALVATGATLLTVVSGAVGLGTAHRLLAALALPPIAALVAAAWVAHRQLLAPALGALGLFGAAALVSGSHLLHVALAAAAFAATCVAPRSELRSAEPDSFETRARPTEPFESASNTINACAGNACAGREGPATMRCGPHAVTSVAANVASRTVICGAPVITARR